MWISILIEISFLIPCGCCGASLKPVATAKPASLFFSLLTLFCLLIPGHLRCPIQLYTLCYLCVGQWPTFTIYAVSTCNVSEFVLSYMSSVNLHYWMCVQISIIRKLMFMPEICLCSCNGFVMNASLQCRVLSQVCIICTLNTGVCIVAYFVAAATVLLHLFFPR